MAIPHPTAGFACNRGYKYDSSTNTCKLQTPLEVGVYFGDEEYVEGYLALFAPYLDLQNKGQSIDAITATSTVCAIAVS